MKKIFFWTLIFATHPLHKNTQNIFVVWNVGQGQWATLVHSNYCHHFDMGGEKNVLQRVLKLCASKKNFLTLSHSDTDHVNFIWTFSRQANTCITRYPQIRKIRLQQTLNSLKLCKNNLTPFFSPREQKNIDQKKISANDLSDVYILKNKLLLPGDSTKKMEKIWATQIPQSNQIKYILLGHHGSHYSNSNQLLDRLHRAKLAIASARKRKYGHPHRAVKTRLKKRGIPLISTEQWGNIYIHNF